MYIKQVLIRGFKTYKEQVSLTEDLHCGINVVVGVNGAGKSNFFNAILFVISDHFGTLRAETRKSLLHEGSGPAVLTAFVELVFDNSDQRLPVDRDEVRLRRTIGVKKDDYSLDGRHATRSEILSLLESSGFARTNPYYVVQQGRVSELTMMNDSRRLELLEEISGASVYEEKKRESQRVLEEVHARQQKISDVLATLALRIRSLEEEQRELVEYQTLERERKCIEFEVTDRDWRTAQNQIDNIEHERREATSQLQVKQRAAGLLHSKLQEVEAELSEASGQQQRKVLQHRENERVLGTRHEQVTRLRLDVLERERCAAENERERSMAVDEEERIKAEMAEVKIQLKQLEQELLESSAARREKLRRKQVIQAQHHRFLASQQNPSHHSSVQQRNAALGQEVTGFQLRRDKSAKQLQDCDEEIRRADEAAKAAATSIVRHREDVGRLEQELSSTVALELQRLEKLIEDRFEQRRQLMQESERLGQEWDVCERRATQLRHRIESTMPRPQRNAIHEVKRWIASQGLEQRAYGTLLDNIEVPQAYCVAAESTAGSALFNLLVQDDEIAGQIVSLVRRGSLGNIVCTPLNRLRHRPRQYPLIDGATPLVNVISCPDWAKSAVHQVFGNTIVCSTLELCEEVSKAHGLDTITLDGDKVSCLGTLTGGYQDPNRFLRLSLAQQLRQAEAQVSNLGPRLAELEVQTNDASEGLDSLHRLRGKQQDERFRMRAAQAASAEAAREADAQVLRHREAMMRHSERKDELEKILGECDAHIEALEAEICSPSLGIPSAHEREQMQQISREHDALQKELEGLNEQCHSLQRTFKGRERHLEHSLRSRLNDLESMLIRTSQADHAEELAQRRKALTRQESEHAELSTAVETSRNEVAEIESVVVSKKTEHDQLLSKDQAAKAELAQYSSQIDDMAEKVNKLLQKKSEADEKLRSLAVVSSDMSSYKEMTPTDLMEELARTNRELSKFDRVNKKAIDQFATFKDQLEELESKRAELDQSREAVLDFIAKVDEQKEATLLRTLEQVNKHFGETFAALVPGGISQLRKLRAQEDDRDVASRGRCGSSRAPTEGVGIEVSFAGQSTSLRTMAQLSGGQKTLVALALIFSIQRLEPAPFYLFDEIDAALDIQHRIAIAKLIEQSARDAQMIITTFRPEIISVAHRFYHVRQRNRVSQIESVPRHEAERIIEQQTHNEN